eukprot:COSAG04_NODE_3783_length_2535_cov_1.426108_3_plen_372_part_01
MHVAKVNHAAIATACGLERDVVTTGIKELLWCLLEAMANRPDCLLDVGVGDIRAKKRVVDIAFDRPPGKGSSMPAMAPLTAQSESAMSRLSLSSSASTLRPPSAAGTEIDWDSLEVTGAGRSQAPDEATIEEGDEGAEEAAGEEEEEEMGLPPIAGAEPLAETAESAGPTGKELSEAYLANHKSSKDWVDNHAEGPHDDYLNKVFDRFEDALLRSEQQLKDEQAEVEQAAAAEAELREALAAKKKEERLAVARSPKTQIKLREKELERARLEAMITGEPQFPGEPPQSSRRSFVNLDGERQIASDMVRVWCRHGARVAGRRGHEEGGVAGLPRRSGRREGFQAPRRGPLRPDPRVAEAERGCAEVSGRGAG